MSAVRHGAVVFGCLVTMACTMSLCHLLKRKQRRQQQPRKRPWQPYKLSESSMQ